jgi:hypothetical protein
LKWWFIDLLSIPIAFGARALVAASSVLFLVSLSILANFGLGSSSGFLQLFFFQILRAAASLIRFFFP